MKVIEMTSYKLKEFLESHEGELNPIDLIKAWVNQYEVDSKLDELIAFTTHEVIGRIGQSIIKEINKTKTMTGRRSIEIAVQQLRKLADYYDKKLESGEEDE